MKQWDTRKCYLLRFEYLQVALPLTHTIFYYYIFFTFSFFSSHVREFFFSRESWLLVCMLIHVTIHFRRVHSRLNLFFFYMNFKTFQACTKHNPGTHKPPLLLRFPEWRVNILRYSLTIMIMIIVKVYMIYYAYMKANKKCKGSLLLFSLFTLPFSCSSS